MWLIGAVLCPSPALSAELDVPRVMLKNISYDIRLDADSLDQGTQLEAIRLVVDGQMILTWRCQLSQKEAPAIGRGW